MELLGKIMLGFFVGLLCGLIPLIYGFLTDHRITALVGLGTSTAIGVLFAALGRQPFAAIVVAIIFILFHIAQRKRQNHEKDDDSDSDMI